MLTTLRGQKALVMGASRGIGKAIALALAEEGCDIALVARASSKLDAAAQECELLGVRGFPVPADFCKDEGPEAAFSGSLKELGGLHLLVHSDGVAWPGSAEKARWQDWEQMLRLNLSSAMQLTQLALPTILKEKNATIIFIASVSGKMGFNLASGYCASKHGIVGFASALFEDVRGYGKKVSSICPGFVGTEMVAKAGLDPKLVIQPEAVADCVRFVARFPGSGCPTKIILRSQNPPWL